MRNFTGDGFLCVGDAHRFIDPIFSFGVYFAIKEAGFAANAIIQALQENETPAPDAFSAYERLVERGQNAIQDLLDCFWQKPLIFMIFAHYQHRDGVIDLFAGRLYHESIEEMPVLKAIREQLRPKTRAA
jgi:2-polyprenyl-6-methoxyphenol hydroxylase-like FAD-dependent oxidoreductase